MIAKINHINMSLKEGNSNKDLRKKKTNSETAET